MKKLLSMALMAGLFLLPHQNANAVPGGCLIENTDPALLADSASNATAIRVFDGAEPLTLGALDPLRNVPLTVTDTSVPPNSFDLCLDGANCLFDPVEAGNVYSEQIGHGLEAFWWSGEAAVASPDGTADGLLVLAVESAFNPEVVDPANHLSFIRLRIRATVPVAGDYVITHPYGRVEYDGVQTQVGGREINDTFQVPFVVGNVISPSPVQGQVGPLLTFDPITAAPAGFVGSPFVDNTVTGSPCGTNFFMIEGTDTNGDPIDLNGAAPGTALQTDLFGVQGHLTTPGVPLVTPLAVTRATYSRPSTGGTGRVNIFASSIASATVTTESAPALPLVTMTKDGALFFTSYEVVDSATIPNIAVVTASSLGQNDTVATPAIIDEIDISVARYNPATGVLTVKASSSDGLIPPTLTLSDGLGTVTSGVSRNILNVTVPPIFITVTSSAGGMTTQRVEILEPGTLRLF